MLFLLKWLAGLAHFDKELRHFYRNDRRLLPGQRPPLTGTAGVSPASGTVRCDRFSRRSRFALAAGGTPAVPVKSLTLFSEELFSEELDHLKLTHG